MSKQEIITKLLDLWYQCIGPTPHKTRDCLFSIRSDYCTYRETEFVVEHNGYVLHRLPREKSFQTYEEAESYLISVLLFGILRETENVIAANQSDDSSWADLSSEKAYSIKSDALELVAEEGLQKELDEAREIGGY